MKPWLRYLLLTFWLGATVYFNTVAAELYRYKNKDSVTVLDGYVPARYVKSGYAILSLDGRVLEVVPRALSDREIRERDRSLAAAESIAGAKRKREIADQNLMRLYGAPSDVIGKDRLARISSLENRIAQVESAIAKKEDEKGTLSIAYAEDLKRVKEMYQR
jgi:hypothetical protein